MSSRDDRSTQRGDGGTADHRTLKTAYVPRLEYPPIKAAQILSVSPRTIMRMADDGRLRRVGSHIDVRSICHYIENDQEMNFRARYRKRYPALRDDSTMADGEFFAASRGKRRH